MARTKLKKVNRQLKSINIGSLHEDITINEIENIPMLRDIIYSELYDAVIEAFDKSQDSITLFEINNSGFLLELDKKDWATALKNAMFHYEKSEMFERCALIRNLIEKTNGRVEQNNTGNRKYTKRKDTVTKKKEKLKAKSTFKKPKTRKTSPR